jgi:hypothetical protein
MSVQSRGDFRKRCRGRRVPVHAHQLLRVAGRGSIRSVADETAINAAFYEAQTMRRGGGVG